MISISSADFIVLGGGAMGSALAIAMARGGYAVTVVRPKESKKAALQNAGVAMTDDWNVLCATNCPVIFAVKPWVLPELLLQVKNTLFGRDCCSLAAGVTLDQLNLMAPEAKWSRAMPNLACEVGSGCSAYVTGSASEHGSVAFHDAFACGGTVICTDEKGLNAISALCGSGIAFVLDLLESFFHAGLLAGLPADVALQAAIGSFSGAAALAKESGIHPAILRDSVCTPGGTTIKGLKVLRDRGAGAAIVAALEETYRANG